MKKSIYLLLTFIFAFNVIEAQVVSWSPFFPKENDAISIIFDATQGNGLLANADTPLYVHTGVITNLSQSDADWRYVKFGWTTNDPSAKLTFLGNNKFQITLTPSSFYSLPNGEKIKKLAMVFRNATGTIKGSNENGSDIYIPIYSDNLNCVITGPVIDPSYPYIDSSSTVFTIKAKASQSCNFSLYLNNAKITSVNSDYLQYDLSNFAEGTNWIKVIADDGTYIAADSIFVKNPPQPVIAALPSEARDGVTYINDSTVIFNLYAPGKKNVYVLGDFNNWTVNDAYYMNKTPDGTRFWLKIDNLTPGKEYAFQYYVDLTLKIADPFSEKILDPVNDKYINNATYPEWKAYPINKTEGIVGVLQTAQASYNWTTTSFTRPEKTDLVIYELHMRDFLASHRYSTLKDTLNYFKKLGVNVIELLPVNEFEGNDSWGYNPSLYFAPDKYYGTKNSLKEFIDKAHSMGIAVIIDIALNHSFSQSPMVQLYWDKVNNRPAANSPWFNPIETHPFNVGYDFNHESTATQYFVDRVTEYWLKEFKIDGYRFDLTKGFTQKNTLNNVDEWSKLDTSRVRLLSRMVDHIWSADNKAYVIFEHLADNAEETLLSQKGIMLWGNLNYSYNQATMGYADASSDFSWGYYKNRGWTDPNVVTYMESHDEERLMFKNLNYGKVTTGYSTKDLNTALKRMEQAAAFFFTIPGPKMIWEFEELGYDYSIDYNGRVGAKPIKWNYFNVLERRQLFNVYSALIKLKTTYPAFKSNKVTLNVKSTFKSITILDASMTVKVLGNFGVTSTKAAPGFTQTGYWYDYLSGDSINVTDVNAQLSFEPGEYHIYTSVKLAKPDMSTGLNDITSIEGGRVIVYPNPATNNVTIAFELQQYQPAEVKIYNILGEEVKNFNKQYLPVGYNEINWDLNQANGKKVEAGVYFIRISTENSVYKSKIIVNQ